MNLKYRLGTATTIALTMLALLVPNLAVADQSVAPVSSETSVKEGSIGIRYAQYYPPSHYPPPGYYPPPCYAVTPGPFRGAARGAAGGAIFGGIAGNAGKGAAIGAGIGLIGGAARRAAARSSGACY